MDKKSITVCEAIRKSGRLEAIVLGEEGDF